MKVAVVGAGAMGCLFGGLLVPVASVVLIDPWKDHVAAINTRGLELTGVSGERTLAIPATGDPLSAGTVDLAITFVKSHQTPWAAQVAQQILAPSGLALTLQNGLGNAEVLEAAIGKECTCVGTTAHGATLLGPGRVRHAGAGATHLGTRPENADKVRDVAALFASAGIEVHISDNVDSLLWGKVVINAGINALTALMRVPNGALNNVEPLRALMDAAASEAAAVARAKGIVLPYPDPVARVRAAAEMTASNRSSMLQDALRNVPTEVHVINGIIVREGAALGVPTPVNMVLLRLVEAMESTYQERC